MKVELPGGEPWLFWRVVTSPRTKETQEQIEDWSFERLWMTSDVYDAIDRAEAQAQKEAENGST